MKRLIAIGAALGLAACSSNDNNCDLANPSCSDGLVCEAVQGQTQAHCFPPVQVKGRVFDLSNDGGIAGARVIAETVSEEPVGDVAVTNPDGTYALRVPSTRSDTNGTPVATKLKLSAAARNFVPFPSGLRVSLPVDTGVRADAGTGYVVSSNLTDIGLQPAAQQGLSSISGKAAAPAAAADGGTPSELLIAAEQTGGSGSPVTLTARADATGSFTVFNVPNGSYQVKAYRRGSNYTPATVSVNSADVTGVNLALASTPTATLNGSVSIVAGSGATSVVMALESTFDTATDRGELVPQLRAPNPGTAPNVTGAFNISGVPDGKYVVLAAFENDGLVRDPDPNIAGTQIQHVVVSGGSADVQPSFKVTSAVTMIGPGAGDGIEQVTGNPTFTWQDYPSAHDYTLDLFDALGTPVWQQTGITATSQAYAGSTALVSGGVYWWRVTANSNAGAPISTTEDLKGVFSIK